MAHDSSESDRISVNMMGSPEEEGWTAVWTRYRPPYLNDVNFSSAQTGSSIIEPRCVTALEDGVELMTIYDVESGYDMDSYPQSPGTNNSDSTAKDKGFQIRDHVLHSIASFNGTLPTESPRLTKEALRVLELKYCNHYPGTIDEWCQSTYYPHAAHAIASLSQSLVVRYSKSHATEGSSSWEIVPANVHVDRTAETVTGIGGHFDDIAAPTLGLDKDDLYNYSQMHEK